MTALPPVDKGRLESIIELGFWLDHRYRIPFTRGGIGWDPIIGLVPVAGGIVTLALAARIILYAHRTGIGRRKLARMIANTCFDALIGMIPFAGAVADVFFRSNLQNLRIVLDHLETSGFPR